MMMMMMMMRPPGGVKKGCCCCCNSFVVLQLVATVMLYGTVPYSHNNIVSRSIVLLLFWIDMCSVEDYGKLNQGMKNRTSDQPQTSCLWFVWYFVWHFVWGSNLRQNVRQNLRHRREIEKQCSMIRWFYLSFSDASPKKQGNKMCNG